MWGAIGKAGSAVMRNKWSRGATFGAAVGGVGGLMGGDGAGGFWGGVAGGAAAGAALGGFGYGVKGGRNLMQRGLAKTGRFAANQGGAVAGKNANLYQKAMGGLYSGATGNRMTSFSNKHGNKALMALGAGSASLIGASALSSNRSL